MFEAYPKTRPPLSPALALVHQEHYRSNRAEATSRSTPAARMEAWLHDAVARDLHAGAAATVSTLEIGAGTLNQLDYEPVVGPYDVVEPFEVLYATSPHRTRVRAFYPDIAQVPAASRYDRITSVATFEHLLDLPGVLARAGLLLALGGALRAAIPSEGTVLWRLGSALTTGRAFRRRYGLSYAEFMAHEHVNTAREIEVAIRHLFGHVRCRVLGLARSLSFYQYYEAREPHAARCEEVLRSRA
jgi:hypothetical protein